MGERILVEIGEQFGARHRVGKLPMVDRNRPVADGPRQRIGPGRGRCADMQDTVKVADRCLRGVGRLLERQDGRRHTGVLDARARHEDEKAGDSRQASDRSHSGYLRSFEVPPGAGRSERDRTSAGILTGPGWTLQCQRCLVAVPSSVIRRAVSVKCRTSSGRRGRPGMAYSRQESHFLRTG